MKRREHDGRTDMRKAALKRRADAWALLGIGKAEHARAAGYLGGYAIECKLKAVAMEIYGCWTLKELARKLTVDERDIYAHRLEALVMRLPISKKFQRSDVWRDFAGSVNQWRVAWRYDPRDWSLDSAREFMQAVDKVYQWIESNQC